MSMPSAAASLIGGHDDSVPISQHDDPVENKNDSVTRPPKKRKVGNGSDDPNDPVDDDNKNELKVGNSSDDPNDAADREAFERWFRLIRQDEEGDYPSTEEKETRFQYFKNYRRTVVTPQMRRYGHNLIHLADRSTEELDDLTFQAFAFCHVSDELLDDLEEICSRPQD